jgi:hypothetical protein
MPAERGFVVPLPDFELVSVAGDVGGGLFEFHVVVGVT